MNQLSWLLYIANVAGTLSTITMLTSILTTALSLFVFFVWVSCKDYGMEEYQARRSSYDKPTLYIRTPEDLKAGRDFLKTTKRIWKTSLSVAIVSLGLFILTPRAETVYAIAASEMGEQILKTPTASKAIKALESWLDKQIRENSK